MKIKHHPAVLILLLVCQLVRAQELRQNIRGTIVDKVSQTPLPGAVAVVLNSSPVIAAFSDAEGKFAMQAVPVGKQSVKVTMMGYKPVVLQNLSLNAGKELVLNIQMEEEISQIEEVEVTAKVQKNKALNDMSAVSTRAFSVEETQKFAAAVNDPARMATSFAGVVGAGDGNNTISIRGNSPNGLLWRMEGVEIPNPNHFSAVGTSGGGISILSAQLLNNSDFSTGAFAAEYGNALSGVFDLKLRKGNNQKREYTLQAGLLGVDVAMEGPFKEGYDGSYLINYRYSTLSMLGKIGVPLGDAVTNFQDLSFNVALPTKKYGNFGMFGFGGISNQTIEAKKDSLEWKKDDFYRYTARYYSNTGATGFTHTKLFNNQSYLKTVLAFSGTQNGEWYNRLQNDYATFKREREDAFDQYKAILSSVYTQKLNARSSIRSGLIVSNLGYRLRRGSLNDDKVLVTNIDEQGSTQTLQAFSQWQYKPAAKFRTNLGLHYMHLLLNNSKSVEPRFSVAYEPNNKNTLSAGYGLHSQVQPVAVYFTRQYTDNGSYTKPNKNLGLSKSHHLVLGYDRVLTEYSHIKLETYYQHLFNIPTGVSPNSEYSMLNVLDGVTSQALNNKGQGKNYGAELTYERFLHKNLYYLVSGSVFESKYRTAAGKWFDTRYNTNYALTITVGKEWNISNSRKNRFFGFNVKSVYVGGMRYTPIDLQASLAKGEEVLQSGNAFSKQNPAYYRLDTRISLKRNYKHVTGTLALDIQNTTNRQNVGGQYFDLNTGAVKYWYQAPLIPILSYRLEF